MISWDINKKWFLYVEYQGGIFIWRTILIYNHSTEIGHFYRNAFSSKASREAVSKKKSAWIWTLESVSFSALAILLYGRLLTMYAFLYGQLLKMGSSLTHQLFRYLLAQSMRPLIAEFEISLDLSMLSGTQINK